MDTTNTPTQFAPPEIALDQIHDSPFQPRTEYNGIDELAENIKAEGRIHTPLKVRPRAAGGVEIVFGHRRKRGAIKAGLATAPCLIVEMTDAEVRSAQMTENIQRENMTALEEARGFRAQMDNDGLSPLEISKRIGKSRSFVYGRLRLLDLCPEVREAVEAGDIDAESALLVARVGNEKMQRKALGYIKAKYYDLEDGGAKSFRQVRDLLNERFTLQLDKAIFDPSDELLLADVGNCLSCPKLTGNAPEFADIANQPTDEEIDKQDEADQDGESQWQRRRELVRNRGKAVCTDPDCFDAKKKAHLKNEAAKLASGGAVVVDGNKARTAIGADGKVKGAYIALADVKAQIKKLPKAGDFVGGVKMPATVVIQNPRDGTTVEAYRRDELNGAGFQVKAEPSAQASHAEQERKRQEDRKAAEEKAQVESERRYALLLRVREAGASRTRSAFELRMAASQALNAVGYHDAKTLARLYDVKSKAELERRVDTLDPAALTTLLLDCLIVDNVACESYNMNQKPGPLLALANHYGVDPKAVQTPARPAATPKAAAPAQQKAGAAGQVKYRDPATGSTWSGRGLQPAWLKAAIAAGKQLGDFLQGAEAVAASGKKAKRKPLLAAGDPAAPDDAGLFDEAEAAT